MKMRDIIKENDQLIMEVGQGLKPEERLGSRLGQWFKKKFTTDPIADKTRVAAGRNRTAKAVAKPTKGDSALDYDDAGYEKYDNPADASTIADLEKADYDSEMAQWNADNKKKSAIVNPDAKAGQVASAAGEFGTSKAEVNQVAKAGQDREAFADPSTLRDTVKVGRPNRARTALPPASTSTVSGSATNQQAADKFAQSGRAPAAVPAATAGIPTSTAPKSKYPKGDIRNLGKYIKPANVTNQGGKKMAGDVEPQKKGADLRNLLKLAGVKQPRSDDDKK